MPGESAAAAAPEVKKSGNKRRRKPAPGETVLLPADERDRRERQRRLRAMALKVRAQGQEYNAKRHKQHKPRRTVQVIIVPIWWNKHAAEKEAVLEAAATALALLRGAGIKSDTDSTNELTPGQKFRAWEEKGVRLRLEIGPKEAQAGRCILARCATPGEVAQKTSMPVNGKLLAALRTELGLPADSGPGPAAVGAAAAAGGAAAATAGGGGEAAGQGEAAAAAKTGQSGDDIDGDFGGVDLLPDPQGKKKKARKAAAAAAEEAGGVGAAAAEDGAAAAGPGKGKKKARQPKHVSF